MSTGNIGVRSWSRTGCLTVGKRSSPGRRPFLSHCRRCVFPVKCEILANEDSQLSAATKYEKEACELSDQRISRAIFLRII